MTALAGPVLALETSVARCAVAVLRGGDVLALLDEPMARGQAERLMPMISEALGAAGLSPADLAAVAVCTGPGNFTGVRIGVAAARGLALALSIPAVGVPRLDALAEAAGGGPLIAAAGAPRGTLYAQAFDAAGAPASPLELGPPERLAAALAGAVRVVGPPGPAEALAAALGVRLEAASDLADPFALARLALRRLAAGPVARPAPIYPRPPDAAPPSEPPPRLLA